MINNEIRPFPNPYPDKDGIGNTVLIRVQPSEPTRLTKALDRYDLLLMCGFLYPLDEKIMQTVFQSVLCLHSNSSMLL